MAKSFVEFKGKGFWCQDAYLEVWTFYMVKEIEKQEPAIAWLQQIKEKWHNMATSGMLGSINLQLDLFVTDEVRRAALLDIAIRVNNFLFQHGGVLPLEFANKPFELMKRKGFVEPPETSNILKVGKLFINLLRGELSYTAAGPFEYLTYENWRKP